MIENSNPFQILVNEPERTPLGLEKGKNKFQPLPSGGLVSDAINGKYVGIDPTEKFDPNAWSLRKRDEDTWSEIRALELAAGAPQGSNNAWENFFTWLADSDKPIFNDTAQGASIKAMYMNMSPMQLYEFGDHQLTPEAVKGAHETLRLLMAEEKPGAVFDPNNVTDNQRRIQETLRFLGYAKSRQSAEENRNYSYADYYAATNKDTYGLFGSTGPWGLWAEKFGEFYGSGKEMPKDAQDIIARLNADDPNFDYQKFWEEKTKDPLVMEGLMDSGISIDLIRNAKNEDAANYLMNQSLVTSDIQRRIAAYNAQHNWMVRSSVSVTNFGAGMIGAPDIIPFTLGTMGVSTLLKIGITAAGTIGTRLLPAGFIPVARTVGMVAEGIGTVPFGMHPTYLANMNVLARMGASMAGMASISAMHDVSTQNKQIAFGAAIDYQDPNAKIEYDLSETMIAAAHGAVTGLTMFGLGAGLEAVTTVPFNVAYGPKIKIGKGLEIRDFTKAFGEEGFSAKSAFAHTTFGELIDTFGSIKDRFGTLIGRSPSESVKVTALLDGTEPKPEDLVRETNNATSRADVRSATNPEAATEKPLTKELLRGDAETRADYAKRIGAAGLIEKPFMFFSQLARRVNADEVAGDALGEAAVGKNLFNMSAAKSARILQDAKQRVAEARAAETEAAGGTLDPKRAAVYDNLEATRQKWLKNSIRRMTSVERNAFLAETRTGTPAEKIQVARNTAIDKAERTATAESLAAQLLENARDNTKPSVNLDKDVAKATEDAALEHKVTGEISEQTAKNLKAVILGEKPKTFPKITKIINKAVNAVKNKPQVRKNILSIAKNREAFLDLAKGNIENIEKYYDATCVLVAEDLITTAEQTLLLCAALDFDFNSTAFNIDYKFDYTSEGTISSAYYESATNSITFNVNKLQEFVDLEAGSSVFLHELGHALFQHTIGTKDYIKVLKAYNDWSGPAGIGDAVIDVNTAYTLTNAEEMFVQSFAGFMLAKNKALIAESLTPKQQSMIKFWLDSVAEKFIETVIHLNESTYYNQVQHIMKDITKAQSVLKNSIGNVTLDVTGILNVKLDRPNFKVKKTGVIGPSSGVSFSPREIYYITEGNLSSPELAAFIMLKSDNLSLFTTEGYFSKNFKKYLTYYDMQRNTQINAFLMMLHNDMPNFVDLVSDGSMSNKKAIKTINALLKQGPLEVAAAPGTYQMHSLSSFAESWLPEEVILAREIELEFHSSPLELISNALTTVWEAESLPADAVQFNELISLYEQAEKDPVLSKSTFELVRDGFLESSKVKNFASSIESEALAEYLNKTISVESEEVVAMASKRKAKSVDTDTIENPQYTPDVFIGTARDVLTSVIKDTDGDVSTVASALLRVLDKDTLDTTTVYDSADLPKNEGGRYSSFGNRIKMNDDQRHLENKPRYITHEIVHAGVMDKIAAVLQKYDYNLSFQEFSYNTFSTISGISAKLSEIVAKNKLNDIVDPELDAIVSLADLYLTSVKMIAKEKNISDYEMAGYWKNKDISSTERTLFYGFRNLNEFIAEVVSNPAFRDRLSKYTILDVNAFALQNKEYLISDRSTNFVSPETSTLASMIWSSIKKLIGIDSIQRNSIVLQALVHIEKLMQKEIERNSPYETVPVKEKSASIIVPKTTDGLADGLAKVTKGKAEEAFGKLIDVLDPIVLAMVGKSDSAFAAIKQLEVMARSGDLAINEVTGKWELKKTEVAPAKAVPVKASEPTKAGNIVKVRAKTVGPKLADFAPKETEAVVEDTAVTENNLTTIITHFVDPTHQYGKMVLGLVGRNNEDSIQQAWIRFTSENGLANLKQKIAEGKYKTAVELRKLFVATAKRITLDSLKKGQSRAGIEKLRVERAKLIGEIKRTEEAGKSTEDLKIDLEVIDNEIARFKSKKTEGIVKTNATTGKEATQEGVKPVVADTETTTKDLQTMRAEIVFKLDQMLRRVLNLSENNRGLLTQDQMKLWQYIFKTTDKVTNADLAAKSEQILGRKVGVNSIQAIRASVLKAAEEFKATLGITEQELTDSVIAHSSNAEGLVFEESSKAFQKFKEYVERINTEVPKPKNKPPVKEAKAEVKKILDKTADSMALSDTPPASTTEVPQNPAPENTTVAYNVTNEAGETVGPDAMTSNAADNLIAANDQPLTKKAIAIPTDAVVATTERGEVVVAKDTDAVALGSVKVESKTGELVVENGTIVKKDIEPVPTNEATPKVKVTKVRTKTAGTKPVSPKTEEHVDFERKVNENQDTLRANGMDTGFLAHFQRAYWKAMKVIDKAGSRTVITPLFREMFTQFIAINNAIHEANIAKFGEDMAVKFWANVDRIRTEDTRRFGSEPGYKRLTEAQIMAKAAKATHPEYMAPALLDADLKIVGKDGKYSLAAKNAKSKVNANPKPEAFPAPETSTATEAPKAPEVAKASEATKDPEVAKAPEAAKAPEVAKASEAAKAPEAAADAGNKKPTRLEIIGNAIYGAGNSLSMPLRWSNFIAWIFAGSNLAERSWYRKQMSNLANLTQRGSRLGDTARSNFAGLRILAGLMDSSRVMTGMLVDGGQSAILTLIGSKHYEGAVIARLMKANFEINKFFGANKEARLNLDRYIWRKTAAGEKISEASLVSDLGMTSVQAKALHPLIERFIDTHIRTNEMQLRLGRETGLTPTKDAEGKDFDPNTWMPVQFDEEGLARMEQSGDGFDGNKLRERLVAVRRLRKANSKTLDVNTMIVLGWLTVEDAAYNRMDDLMLSGRKIGEAPDTSRLSKETLDKLEKTLDSGVKVYRKPKTKDDLSPADLKKYMQAISGDTSNYIPEYLDMFEPDTDLVMAEIEELVRYKMKQGRYYESRGNDRPLLKTKQRSDVALAVPGLTPAEVLSDSEGILLKVIRTNLADSQKTFLSGRLTELIFQKQLDSLFGQKGITFEEVLEVVKTRELNNVDSMAKEQKWTPAQIEAAKASIDRGIKRIELEYRSHVETLPYKERDGYSEMADGALTIARIPAAVGYGMKALTEATMILAQEPIKNWPVDIFKAIKYLFGEYRLSRSGMLGSDVGDLYVTLHHMRYNMHNSLMSLDTMGAKDMDGSLNGLFESSRWNNAPMRLFEKMAKVSEIVGSLDAITNFTRDLAKNQTQRRIFHAIKNGHIQALLQAMKDPANNEIAMNYLREAATSEAGGRAQWRRFADLARKNKFGKNPHDALFFLQNGLDSVEKIQHLAWALEQVGDSEGRANFIRMFELAEDVRRKPVEGIDPDMLETVIAQYSSGIQAELSKRSVSEPFGLNRIMESGPLGKVIYALSGWMRGFQDGRIIDYGRTGGVAFMGFIAAYAVIESVYQLIREWLSGRDASDILLEMKDNPASIISRFAYSIPAFGLWNGLFEAGVSQLTNGTAYMPSRVDVATPGLATALSVPSRMQKSVSSAYKAFSQGKISEGIGYMGTMPILPVSAYVNNSPLAIPARIMEESIGLDENHAIQRWLKVVHRDSDPYASKAGIKISNVTSRNKAGTSYDNRAQQLRYAERLRQQEEAKAKAMEKAAAPKTIMPSPKVQKASGVSAPLADLLGDQSMN